MEYYEIIRTEHPENVKAVQVHKEKLNNYLYYGYAATNEDIASLKKQKLPQERKVERENFAITVKNNNLVLITTLCCDDDYGPGY